MQCDILWNKKAELDKIEDELMKERAKRDYKKHNTKVMGMKKQQTMSPTRSLTISPKKLDLRNQRKIQRNRSKNKQKTKAPDRSRPIKKEQSKKTSQVIKPLRRRRLG